MEKNRAKIFPLNSWFGLGPIYDYLVNNFFLSISLTTCACRDKKVPYRHLRFLKYARVFDSGLVRVLEKICWVARNSCVNPKKYKPSSFMLT